MGKKQKEVAFNLGRCSVDVKNAYLGALQSVQLPEYDDRLIQFSQSLREAIDQLAKESLYRIAKNERSSIIESDQYRKMLGRRNRGDGIRLMVDTKLYHGEVKKSCECLVDMYSRLSKIAHHNRKDITQKYCEEQIDIFETAIMQIIKSEPNQRT